MKRPTSGFSAGLTSSPKTSLSKFCRVSGTTAEVYFLRVSDATYKFNASAISWARMLLRSLLDSANVFQCEHVSPLFYRKVLRQLPDLSFTANLSDCRNHAENRGMRHNYPRDIRDLPGSAGGTKGRRAFSFFSTDPRRLSRALQSSGIADHASPADLRNLCGGGPRKNCICTRKNCGRRCPSVTGRPRRFPRD